MIEFKVFYMLDLGVGISFKWCKAVVPVGKKPYGYLQLS
jgi:hypothetical protein